jgi:hypothetical protein
MFEIKGDTATFHSDGAYPNNKGWRMNISDIAIIALAFDDVPDFSFKQTILFVNKKRQIFKVDINKFKDTNQFDSFWKTVSERLGIDIDYRREFFPSIVKIIYPNELHGARLFQPWSITSWPAITFHFLSHLLSAEKRMLNGEIIPYLNMLREENIS